MRNFGKILLILGLIFSFNSVCALDFTNDITISDLNTDGSDGWWGDQEDQEVEPGMVQDQAWDLEGFFLNGNILSVVGGYNFVTGEDGLMSGDIFIDIDGDAEFGDIDGSSNGNNIVSNTYGYDYVFDLTFSTTNTYAVYDLNYDNGEETRTITSYYKQNQGSSPWRYESGGELLTSGTFDFLNDLSDLNTGFGGGTHYAITGFDLSFLSDVDEFTVHTTMECGNDNLMGRSTTATVPEPASMLLLGTGLIGLAGISRKKLI